MSYVCPVCHNDRHPPRAKFCMVCGTGFPLSNRRTWRKRQLMVRGLEKTGPHIQAP